MKFYYIFVPCFIVAFTLGIHFFFKWWTWRKELRRDAQKKLEVDKLLEVDLDDWYEREYPTKRLLENQ